MPRSTIRLWYTCYILKSVNDNPSGYQLRCRNQISPFPKNFSTLMQQKIFLHTLPHLFGQGTPLIRWKSIRICSDWDVLETSFKPRQFNKKSLYQMEQLFSFTFPAREMRTFKIKRILWRNINSKNCQNYFRVIFLINNHLCYLFNKFFFLI